MSSGFVNVVASAVVVGARKFVFPSQIQSSSRVAWWGPVEERSTELNPRNVQYFFVKSNLARKVKIHEKAVSRGAEYVEFDDESEIFEQLSKILDTKTSPVKEVPAPVEPDLPEEVLEVKKPKSILKPTKIEEVLVSRIRPNPNQPRKYFNEAKLKMLGESIVANGQYVLIILLPVVDGDPDHDYEIFDGERRWRAAQKVGKPTMMAVIAENLSEAEKFKGSAISNFGREGHTHQEIARALAQVKYDFGYTIQKLAAAFAMSVNSVNMHLEFLKLKDGVQDLVSDELPDRERLAFVSSVEIAKLPKEYQSEAVKHILHCHLSTNGVRHYIRRLMVEKGLTNDGRKGRRRRPDDDFVVFRTILSSFLEKTNHLLHIPEGWGIEDLFINRSEVDAESALCAISSVVANLEKIRVGIESSQQKHHANKVVKIRA